MTSAELWQVGAEPEEDAAAPEGDSASGGGTTPWSGQRNPLRSGSGAVAPASGTPPGTNSDGLTEPEPGPAAESEAEQAGTEAETEHAAADPAGTPNPAPPAAAPEPPAPQPDPAAEPPPAPTGVGTVPPTENGEEGESPFDVENLIEMAPMAAMLASSVLPMLSSALSGLAGGGGGDTGAAAGLSPESQRALEALKLLAEVYGDGASTDPDVIALREELGLTDAGSGEGAAAIEDRQRWQTYAPKAFNNLDADLDFYISTLAGANNVSREAINSLLRETNVALAALGEEVYTKAGQQKAREILTQALTKAQEIVGGSAAGSEETAAAIENLTNQWIANISGQEYTSPMSPKAQVAIDAAMAQQGKPYVWGEDGPNAFDCSGLVRYAAAQAGVMLPHNADAQYKSLDPVTGTLQPGDLIFPSDRIVNGTAEHVIMYIGNGQCIAASNQDKPIGLVDLPDSYEARRWTGE
ncbi:C40 family peptidase [Nocardia sp. NPDC127579]|uniref:C40 family peptidase n=1 Tax=Nocardia sp. NPDC127579 TaxID=3345402 RepID=UPI00362A80D7